MLNFNPLERSLMAIMLAQQAHKDQKYGAYNYFPYHVMPLAEKFPPYSDMQIIALLHDVVEDSVITVNTISNLFGGTIGKAVDALTRRPDEHYDVYITRVADNALTTRVKIEDLRFHLSQPEPRNVDRYEKALVYLESL